MSAQGGPVISLMLAVPDAPTAVDWYKGAMGATELWNLGSVVGLDVEGAPFFVAQPANNGWNSPAQIGTTTVRVELVLDRTTRSGVHAGDTLRGTLVRCRRGALAQPAAE